MVKARVTGLRSPGLLGAVALACVCLSAGAAASPGPGHGGSGSDGVEDKIEDKVDDKVEDRIRDALEDHAKGKVDKKIDRRIESRSGHGSGSGRRIEDRVDSRATKKGDARIRSDGAVRAMSSGAQGDAAIKAAERSAKSKFDAAVKAADLQRDIARSAARAAFDAAIKTPGADTDALKAAYDVAKDLADAARDQSRETAKSEYEATISTLRGEYDVDDQSIAADAERIFEIGFDSDGNVIERGEWLLLGSPQDRDAANSQGFLVREEQSLQSFDLVLARLEAPNGLSQRDAGRLLRRSAPFAVIDFNHVYYLDATQESLATGDDPAALIEASADASEGIKIGVIDSDINTGHAALAAAQIIKTSFVPYAHPEPRRHGTAVASIIAGSGAAYRGIAPHAAVYAASVFFKAPNGAETATTASLVAALDWLSKNRVSVVNMSLSGPANAILEAAVKRAQSAGMIIVAAVGNDGPAAAPLFPAAYDGVVGVTAVSRDKRIYRLAVQGRQVDFSAPGVNIRHAGEETGFAASTGTSMAAPFVAVAVARQEIAENFSGGVALERLIDTAEDLGARGRDDVFGFGLIRFADPAP